MSKEKDINNTYDDLVNALIQSNLYIVELQEIIIEARKYLLKDIDEKEINYWQKNELFKILGGKNDNRNS